MGNQANQEKSKSTKAFNEKDSLNSDDQENSGKVYSKNLMGSKAEEEVRENEDASLQDDTYSFDESNTGSEDYHDVSELDDVGPDSYLH